MLKDILKGTVCVVAIFLLAMSAFSVLTTTKGGQKIAGAFSVALQKQIIGGTE